MVENKKVKIINLKTTPSTNLEATQCGHAGEPHGTLILAEEQSSGRGRLGRAWVSPPGKGLYFSILLRPKIKAENSPMITLAAGLGVLQGLENLQIPSLLLKWPNDILLNRKKLGGILTEMVAKSDQVDFIVLGIGINVTTTPEDFGRELSSLATSLTLETHQAWDRQEILNQILPTILAEIDLLVNSGPMQLVERWNRTSGMLGKKIRFHFLNEKEEKEGKVLGLEGDGKLSVELMNGEIVGLIAEDVTLCS